jgi:hypothetical protein
MKSLVVLLALLMAQNVAAQTATPQNKFQWTEVGQSVAIAGGATYNLYDGTNPTPLVLTGLICGIGSPITDAVCTANIPALTLGVHTVTLTQVISGAESSKSAGLSFTFVIVVTPTSFIVK